MLHVIKTPERQDPLHHVGVGALIASSCSPHTVDWDCSTASVRQTKSHLLLWADAACGFVLFGHRAKQGTDLLVMSEDFLTKTQWIKETSSMLRSISIVAQYEGLIRVICFAASSALMSAYA